jgi:hypothetical protein
MARQVGADLWSAPTCALSTAGAGDAHLAVGLAHRTCTCTRWRFPCPTGPGMAPCQLVATSNG